MKNVFKNKIVQSGLMLLLSIVMLTSASIAWLNSNRDTDASNIDLEIDNTAVVDANIKIYYVNDITGNRYTFVNSTDADHIPTYDVADIAFDEYKRALVVDLCVIVNNSTNSSIDILLNTDKPFIVSDNNFLSNCLSISDNVTINGSILTALDNGKSFVSFNAGNPSKVMTLEFDDIEVVEGQNETEVHKYFLIRYNDECLSYFGDNAEGEIHFSDDLVFRLTVSED